MGAAVVDTQKQRGVFFRRSALIKLVIEQAEQCPGGNLNTLWPCSHDPARANHGANGHRLPHLRQTLHAVGAHCRVDGRHQERGRDSLPTDVADRQNQLVGTGSEEVVVVTAHRARRKAEAMHFKRLQVRNLPWKQLRLHFLRDCQFALQSLLLLLLQNQLLDGFRHRVEGQRKLRQLVRGLDWNTMAEVAAINVLCGIVKVSHSSRNRACHAGADDQRNQFNHGEDDEDRQQDIFNPPGDISQGRKQVGIEHRRTGSNAHQSPRPRQSAGLPVHNPKRSAERDLTVHHVRGFGERTHGERRPESLVIAFRAGTCLFFAHTTSALALLGLIKKTGFKAMFFCRTPVLVILMRVVEGDACRIERDFPQVCSDVRYQIPVQGLAGNHGQFFRPHLKYRGHAQIQFIVVANDLFELLPFANRLGVLAVGFVEKLRKRHGRRILATAANQQNPRAVPGTDSSSSPSAVALPQSCQRLCRWGFAFFDARRKFVTNRCVYRLHAAQLRVDLRGHYEAGELPGEKVDGDDRHRHQQNCGNHANEDVSHDQAIAQAPEDFSLQCAESKDREQQSCVENKKLDPAAKAVAGRGRNQLQQHFQSEESHCQAQRIAGSARDPALWP